MYRAGRKRVLPGPIGQNGGSPALVLILLITLLAVSAAAVAQPLEIINEHGAVTVEVVSERWVRAWRAGQSSDSSDGITVSKSPVRLLIEARPPEGASPDIHLEIPVGVRFVVRTEDGDIRVEGMVRRATLQSLRGSLDLAVPLNVTQLNLEITSRPATVDFPPGQTMPFYSVAIHPRLQVWKLTHTLPSRDLAYGSLDAQLHEPSRLSVRDWPIPEDWPLKPHTLSKAAVQRLVAKAERRRRGGRPAPVPPRQLPVPVEEPVAADDTAIFKFDVRMVSMNVAVSDSGGRPLAGLTKADFIVEEEGKRQDIRVADPEESPFNMAILLDLSGSTSVDLDHMRQAALKLIEMAGPKDQVALYAMSGSMFYRLSSLTTDREALIEQCNALPYPAGGSPLWDTIALVYDDELAGREGERNALIAISDGIDNRISGQSVPSMLRATRLIEASGEMNARIYPIFLLSGERFGRNWSVKARGRMEALARKTGGRLFTARSVADIEPVLPELAEEMRSVYEIAYYPANQDFDGGWRRVSIKVGIPGARVRARPGYFAD